MAKDANRFYVDVCLEIYVPDQGCGEKAVKNENLDAEWFANEICNLIPKAKIKTPLREEKAVALILLKENTYV